MPTINEPATIQNRNPRPRAEIIADLHRVQGRKAQNLLEEGELLIELKEEVPERQDFLDLLSDEFDISEDTAANKIKVAYMGRRFPILWTLKLAKSTLYDLARYPEEQQPTVIAELARHATDNPLRHCDSWNVMTIGVGRHRYGDLPDGMLFGFADLDYRVEDEGGELPFHRTARAAIQEQRPTTVGEAEEIIDTAIDEAREGREEQEESSNRSRSRSRRSRSRSSRSRNEPPTNGNAADGEREPSNTGAADATHGLQLAVNVILNLPPAQQPVMGALTVLNEMVNRLREMRRNPEPLVAPFELVSPDQRRAAAAAIHDAGHFLIGFAASLENPSRRD